MQKNDTHNNIKMLVVSFARMKLHSSEENNFYSILFDTETPDWIFHCMTAILPSQKPQSQLPCVRILD